MEPDTFHPSALASSRAAKVKFFNTQQGVKELTVPRDFEEAMRHERAPQLYDAMHREMSAPGIRSGEGFTGSRQWQGASDLQTIMAPPRHHSAR